MAVLLLLFMVIASAIASNDKVDPALLAKIFGQPSGNTDNESVSPPQNVQTLDEKLDEGCQCVPYYYCDTELNAVHLNDPTLAGYGTLDIRFQECQESIERCCKIPKINREVLPLEPTTSRLKGCGYRNVKGLDFTVSGNGDEAQFGEFPWVVAIIDANNNTYYGVGVLIHPQVVMTGAHIVHNLQSVKIRAGEWDTKTDNERLRSQERLVDVILKRNDFRNSNLYNDMALLRLAEPLQLADHINVICLPDQDESFDGYTDCVANGWGKKSFGRLDAYAVILKKVDLDMVPNPMCNRMLKRTRLGYFFNLHRSFVCAGGEEGKDTCTGDGGAPLACPVGDNRYKLAGLVGWGIGCGQQNVPGVYTKVALFRNWVDDVITSWGFDISGYQI